MRKKSFFSFLDFEHREHAPPKNANAHFTTPPSSACRCIIVTVSFFGARTPRESHSHSRRAQIARTRVQIQAILGNIQICSLRAAIKTLPRGPLAPFPPPPVYAFTSQHDRRTSACREIARVHASADRRKHRRQRHMRRTVV